MSLVRVSTISPGLAKEYDATQPYAAGEYVLYKNAYWRCTSAIPSGEPWTESHWQKDLSPLDELNKRPTKADMDEGWWSEWVVYPNEIPSVGAVHLKYDLSRGWAVVDEEDNVLSSWKGNADSSNLSWSEPIDADWSFTATRHRVSAPIITKEQMDEGWWSNTGICEPAEHNGRPIVAAIALTDSEYDPDNPEGRDLTGSWCVFYADDTIRDTRYSLAVPKLPTAVTGETIVWSAVDSWGSGVTATRHRVAAPVPTKPEDIGSASADVVSALLMNFAPVWTSGVTYSQYNFVRYDGSLYYKKSGGSSTSTTAPDTDTTNWQSFSSLSDLTQLFLPLTGGVMSGVLEIRGREEAEQAGGYTSLGLYWGSNSGITFQHGGPDETLLSLDTTGSTYRLNIRSDNQNFSADLSTLQDLAPAYSSSGSYEVGQLCVKDNSLRRCTAAGTGNAASFTDATIEDILDILRTRVASCPTKTEMEAGWWSEDPSPRRIGGPVPQTPEDLGAARAEDVELDHPLGSWVVTENERPDSISSAEVSGYDASSGKWTVVVNYTGGSSQEYRESGTPPGEQATQISISELAGDVVLGRSPVPGRYVLGSQVDKPLQAAGDYVTRAEITTGWQSADSPPKYIGGPVPQTPGDIGAASLDDILPVWYPDGSVKGESDITQGLKYTIDGGTATIKTFYNTGDADNDNSGFSGTVVIPPYIEEDGARYPVTAIGAGVAGSEVNNNLVEVIVPATVDTVDNYAFRNCRSLKRAYLPEVKELGVSAFYGCALEEAILPKVTSVGSNSLYGNPVRYIYLPKATFIGNRAFGGCTWLDAVDFGNIPRDGVPILDNVQAFLNVPSSCKIAVPDAQYDDWTSPTIPDPEDPSVQRTNVWYQLITEGYRFLEHHDWDYARRYEIQGGGGGSGGDQVQADWAENDAADPSYIRNKPDIATRQQIEDGWWSGWTVAVVPPGFPDDIESVSVGWVTAEEAQEREYATGEGWYFFTSLADVFAGNNADAFSIATASGFAATRHRVAAPIPARPEDIGAASVADATLAPIYSQTPTFSEWTFSGDVTQGVVYSVNFDTDEVPGYILARLYADGTEVSQEIVTSQEVTSISFVSGFSSSLTATRTRTDVVGYTLGTQSDKPLQSALGFTPLSLYPFAPPTFVQTGDWVFTGSTTSFTDLHLVYTPASGENVQSWILYDGSTTLGELYGSDAPEDATTLIFTAVDITATRSQVCTLVPFTNSQLDMEKWTGHIGFNEGDGLTSVTYSNGVWTISFIYYGLPSTVTVNGDEDDTVLSFEYDGSVYTFTRPPSAFTVSVSTSPVEDTMRDLWFVVKAGATTPTIVWSQPFDRFDGGSAAAVAPEANTSNIYHITEYESGKFEVSKQGVFALASSVPSASSATPQMDGTASAGSSTDYARGDHVHPSDTSRQAVSNLVTELNNPTNVQYPSALLMQTELAKKLGSCLVTFKGENSNGAQGFRVNGVDYTGFDTVAVAGVSSFEVLWGGYRNESGDVYVNGVSMEKPTGPVSITRDNSMVSVVFVSCLSPDTYITMADGSSRRLCDIRPGDIVLSIDPETGERSNDRVTKVSCGTGEFCDVWTFENGHTVTTVGRHRFWNVDLGEFMYLEAWNNGERARVSDGSCARLVGHVRGDGEFAHATLFTKKWNNYFAGGLLAGNRQSIKGVLC